MFGMSFGTGEEEGSGFFLQTPSSNSLGDQSASFAESFNLLNDAAAVELGVPFSLFPDEDNKTRMELLEDAFSVHINSKERTGIILAPEKEIVKDLSISDAEEFKSNFKGELLEEAPKKNAEKKEDAVNVKVKGYTISREQIDLQELTPKKKNSSYSSFGYPGRRSTPFKKRVSNEKETPPKMEKEDVKVNDSFENQSFEFGEAIQIDPSAFLQNLKTQYGSSEEFTQFERHFYAQNEELKMIREKFYSIRLKLEKSEEGKRKLELELVSEKAGRDQDLKNGQTHLQDNRNQLNTQIYSMGCAVETWKRKAEASQTEVNLLKEQMKNVEIEKIEALRKFGDLKESNGPLEEYRVCIEAYATRQRDTLDDIQKGLMDLNKSREALELLTEQNEKRMQLILLDLKDIENGKKIGEDKVLELEKELVKIRAEMVQNKAELHRTQSSEARRTELVKKLIRENKDLHCGMGMLMSSMDSSVGQVNKDFLQSIQRLHSDVENAAKRLGINSSQSPTH